MEKVTNYIKITSTPKLKMSPEGDFFRYWVAFLKPLHELANREMDVLAAFLKIFKCIACFCIAHISHLETR